MTKKEDKTKINKLKNQLIKNNNVFKKTYSLYHKTFPYLGSIGICFVEWALWRPLFNFQKLF